MRVRKASHRRLEYHRLECEAGITSERSRRQARRSRTLERPLHGEKPMTNATDHGYPDRSAFAAMRKRQFDAAPSAFRQRSLNVPSALRRQAASRRTRESPRFHRAFTHRAVRALHLLQPPPNPARASHAMHAVLRWRQASFAGACRRKQTRGDPRWIVFS